MSPGFGALPKRVAPRANVRSRFGDIAGKGWHELWGALDNLLQLIDCHSHVFRCIILGAIHPATTITWIQFRWNPSHTKFDISQKAPCVYSSNLHQQSKVSRSAATHSQSDSHVIAEAQNSHVSPQAKLRKTADALLDGSGLEPQDAIVKLPCPVAHKLPRTRGKASGRNLWEVLNVLPSLQTKSTRLVNHGVRLKIDTASQLGMFPSLSGAHTPP